MQQLLADRDVSVYKYNWHRCNCKRVAAIEFQGGNLTTWPIKISSQLAWTRNVCLLVAPCYTHPFGLVFAKPFPNIYRQIIICQSSRHPDFWVVAPRWWLGCHDDSHIHRDRTQTAAAATTITPLPVPYLLYCLCCSRGGYYTTMELQLMVYPIPGKTRLECISIHGWRLARSDCT